MKRYVKRWTDQMVASLVIASLGLLIMLFFYFLPDILRVWYEGSSFIYHQINHYV